jgi:hypothetical protein
MARGFESKDVEFQQAEAERAKHGSGRPLEAGERDAQTRRRTIELALTRARGDLETARAVPHRRMLEQAIGALEQQLAAIPADGRASENADVKG